MKLPDGWTQERGEKVIEVNPGASSEILGKDIDVSFLAMADVSEEGKIISSQRRKLSEVSNGFTYFEERDVLVAKITPCFENGKGAFVSNLVNGRGFGSTEFHVLRAKPQIEPEFLFLLTRTHRFRGNGEKHMVGSAGQRRVPAEYINSYSILLPPKPEQAKITKIIFSWNDSIQLFEDLLAAKMDRKRGLMQQLLTGKTRFKEFNSERWRSFRLGDLLQEVDRYVTFDDDHTYKLASIRRRSEGLFFREALQGKDIKTKVMKTIRAGDFLLSKMQVVHGAWGLVTPEFDGMFVSDSYISLLPREGSALKIEFLNYLSQMRFMRHLAYICSHGVHIEKMTFNLEDFLHKKITIPPTLDEQAKIVGVLSACDEEIKLLEKQLGALKDQKRGLMQKLLIGEIRVKIKNTKN